MSAEHGVQASNRFNLRSCSAFCEKHVVTGRLRHWPRNKIPGILGVSLIGLTVIFSVRAEVQDGDIIFHRSQSHQAQAIAAATKSDYTHMGIIFYSDGKPFVYEAIQPVVRTPLDQWIKRGVGERFVIKRLKDRSKIDFSKVRKEAERFMGKNYDWLFEWSDENIYCSELVWKAYKRASGIEIGSLKKLRDFDLTSQVVRRTMNERYGMDVPLNMDVIAPSDMFDSPKLFAIP